ncbi:hypothetical protein [uncultured Marivita sp.]|uniref:hypothetical protein n=1 Tax=uncultured Marivita sp. TaxID=888080 RepID=UPI00262BE517|nr:hypothetical protein [uncultured Marivita sp.]
MTWRLSGGTKRAAHLLRGHNKTSGYPMNRIIYIVGLVVIVIAILSFIGLA